MILTESIAPSKIIICGSQGNPKLDFVVRRSKINEPNLSVISDNVRVSSEGRDSILG